jgi:LPS sulfotransferase NodH
MLGRFLQAIAATLAHHADELPVHVFQQLLRMPLLLFVHRQERVEEALVLARGDQAPLDAQLVHQAGHAEAVHAHADRADDARAPT